MSVQHASKATTLRVRVIDNSGAGRNVNVRMPLTLVKFGLKTASRFAPDMKDTDADWDAITAAVEQGQLGKILEVEDEAEHKTIELWIE